MRNKIKVYMGIATVGTVIDSQQYILRDLAETYKDYVEFVYPSQCVRRVFHDFARNMIVEDFLATDCDVLWFLDSDITPAKHVLDLIALHWDKWEIAGATYPVFMNVSGSETLEIVFTAYKRQESGAFSPEHVPTEGTAFLDGLATGCLFIKRDVFSKLSKPYFEHKFNAETRNLEEGEDLGFCRKVSDLGIKFFTDFSMVCRHQKNVDLLDLNNYAISYSNKSVLKYDAMIKEQVMESVKAAYKAGFQAALKQAPKTEPSSKVLWTPS